MEICPLSFMYINYPDIFRVSGILVGAVGKGRTCSIYYYSLDIPYHRANAFRIKMSSFSLTLLALDHFL